MAATYQIYALKYGERETKEGQFFFREASQKPLTNLPQMLAGFETIDALAGAKERVVVSHDPEVAARFDHVEPGIVRIA